MEITGSSYLLTLAQLAISFVGFSTIVVALRERTGDELSEYHILLFRLFIELGLIATVMSLTPPALALLGLPQPVIWQISSVLLGTIIIVYLVSYVRRRGRIPNSSLPVRLFIYGGVSILAVVGLGLNALGLPFEPGPGPFTVAVTWTLITGGLAFLQGLPAFLQRTPRDGT